MIKIPNTLKGFTAQDLLDSGAAYHRGKDAPEILEKLRQYVIDRRVKENMKMQELIINANKALTGPPWARNADKLTVLFKEFDELMKLMNPTA